MIYSLCFISLLLFCMAYLLAGRNLLSPMVIACGGFVISIFCAMLNYRKWGFTLEFEAVALIAAGIVSFCLGAIVVSFTAEKREGHKRRQEGHKVRTMVASAWLPVGFAIVLSGMAVCYYLDLKRIVAIGEMNGLAGPFLYVARMAQLEQRAAPRWGIGHFAIFSEAVNFIFLYLFLDQYIWQGFCISRSMDGMSEITKNSSVWGQLVWVFIFLFLL